MKFSRGERSAVNYDITLRRKKTHAFTETYVTNMSVTRPLAGISQFATHTMRLEEREGGGEGQGDYKLKK